ncbi:DUF3099 domain-containing protein [Microbacterium halophytorum]|uniref:DUF3099 domain-containing protein n=1 Tax=Microbacterium halophytorum TaxID=2067568 RepID=UPI000CFD482F|nr:DUF3099 domain-containing protein [Microbacterium halophytorum]
MSRRKKHRQSATSLDVAPGDDSRSRERRYLITMGIRIACLILAVAVQPYGWWTFVFAIGAIFLPYIAVVGANARSAQRVEGAVAPGAAEVSAPAPQAEEPAGPGVFRIDEAHGGDDAAGAGRDRDADARTADGEPGEPDGREPGAAA